MSVESALNRPIPKWVAAVVIISVTAALIAFVIPRVRANWGGRQAERMAACQVVIDREVPMLRDDPRWEDVKFHANANETVYIYGFVQSDEDARALWDVANPWSAEVPLTWSIEVRDWYPPDGEWTGHPDWWPGRRIGSWQE
ncbi:MAG: hypothetical protein DHS20C14_01980 [Phycisphaeraceae bacterium]|nr:MAG: hypothetical protein DHS20C14_01980 [Phycisphaeraceae bacterium]